MSDSLALGKRNQAIRRAVSLDSQDGGTETLCQIEIAGQRFAVGRFDSALRFAQRLDLYTAYQRAPGRPAIRAPVRSTLGVPLATRCKHEVPPSRVLKEATVPNRRATDKSLQGERNKTDELLAQKRRAADQALRENHDDAEKRLELQVLHGRQPSAAANYRFLERLREARFAEARRIGTRRTSPAQSPTTKPSGRSPTFQDDTWSSRCRRNSITVSI